MRVLVVGEGKNDFGYRTPEGWCDGALPVFVRKLLALSDDDEIKCQPWKTLKQNPFAPKRRLHGPDHRVAAWVFRAKKTRFDIVVIVIDRDGPIGKQRLEQMCAGRDRARADLGVDAAVGVAVEEIEAWLLADEKALRKATGDNSIRRQPAPESLASRDKRSENNAKYRLQQLISEASLADPMLSKVYADIAMAADLGTLAERCPKGFAPFADDVRRLKSTNAPA